MPGMFSNVNLPIFHFYLISSKKQKIKYICLNYLLFRKKGNQRGLKNKKKGKRFEKMLPLNPLRINRNFTATETEIFPVISRSSFSFFSYWKRKNIISKVSSLNIIFALTVQKTHQEFLWSIKGSRRISRSIYCITI